MPKSEKQKQKILYILKFLYENTDEDHPLTVNDMIDKLREYDISAERRSVYNDIRTLQDFGFDIIMQRNGSYGYYLGERLFETAELEILIDSVQSSRFITKKKSEKLIKKLSKLTSKAQARNFSRQLHIRDRIKNMNESILYTVDSIHNAISSNRKISFKYFDYNIKTEKVFRRNGGHYLANPLALTFDNENYYLITYTEKYDEFVTYRVDRMSDVTVTDEKRSLPPKPFNVAEYVNPVFSMFDGEIERITCLFRNSLLNVVIDRFGENVTLSEYGDEAFKAVFKAAVSPTFLSWIIGFGGDAYVLSPEWVADEVYALALEAAQQYEDQEDQD